MGVLWIILLVFVVQQFFEVVADKLHHQKDVLDFEHVFFSFVWDQNLKKFGSENVVLNLRELAHDGDLSEQVLNFIQFFNIEVNSLHSYQFFALSVHSFHD